MMSAAVANREVVYYTFYDDQLKRELQSVYNHLKDLKISAVFNLLLNYDPKSNLIDYILDGKANSYKQDDSLGNKCT